MAYTDGNDQNSHIFFKIFIASTFGNYKILFTNKYKTFKKMGKHGR